MNELSRRRIPRPKRIVGALLVALVLVSGCEDEPIPPEVPESTIVIGAFDFTEGLVMSSLYAEVLKANGFEVRVEEVATREIMQPALQQGHIDLVPEYQGTLLLFLQPFADLRISDQRNALVQELNVRDLVALDASPGQNQNEIVVTSETASEYGLTKISDLEPVAGELVFGGPPECPPRPLCLAGLEDDYGLEFEEFIPLDAGGPLTLAALNGGEIDVGLLFGTDPAIDRDGLAVLDDDQSLQPREGLLPILRAPVLESGGDALSAPLNELSARLTTETLRQLNSQVDDQGMTPVEAARTWLEEEDLV